MSDNLRSTDRNKYWVDCVSDAMAHANISATSAQLDVITGKIMISISNHETSDFTEKIRVEAYQWIENGDHPEDDCSLIEREDGGTFLSEGKIVRRYAVPDFQKKFCNKCHMHMNSHGWIDTFYHGYTVCPADWIIKGINGEFYPCNPDIFDKTYEGVNNNAR